MATQQPGLSRQDSFIALADLDVIRQTYDVISKLPNEGTKLDEAHDELYFLFDEIVERFAPDLAVEEQKLHYRTAEWYDDDPLDAEEGLAASLDGIRRRQASRMLRDMFGRTDG